MRKMVKRALTLFAALVAAFAIATPAFADGGTITIDSPSEGKTYGAYKIFDVVAGANNDIEYTITDPGGTNENWYKVVTSRTDLGLEFEAISGSTNTYRVIERPGFEASAFAEFLQANIPDGTTPIGVGNNTSTISVSENGYYLVVSSESNNHGDRAMLTTVLDNNVTIQDKNDMPLDKTYHVNDSSKEVKEGDAQIGDKLTYTLSGKVPDTTGFESFAYVLSDEMSEGLTFDQTSFKVSIGGNDVTTGFLVITDESALTSDSSVLFTDKGFKLSIAMKKLAQLGLSGNAIEPGADIKVTYSATVNENASTKISWNDAVLKYTNKQNTDELTVKNVGTVTYTSSIQVNKFEIGAPEQKLAGATFILSRVVADNTEYYTYDSTDKKVVWVTNKSEADSMTTKSDGSVSFIGLEDGTYNLIETAAPTGYVPLQEAIEVVVDGTPALTVGLTDAQIQLALTKVANVGNFPGEMLPSTGGMGTTFFYAASAVLLVIIVRRFARSSQNA